MARMSGQELADRLMSNGALHASESVIPREWVKGYKEAVSIMVRLLGENLPDEPLYEIGDVLVCHTGFRLVVEDREEVASKWYYSIRSDAKEVGLHDPIWKWEEQDMRKQIKEVIRIQTI